MIRVPLFLSLAGVLSLAVACFGVGSYYGAVYMMVNDKLNWCYGWAHSHQMELQQAEYMKALQWCDWWNRENQ